MQPQARSDRRSDQEVACEQYHADPQMTPFIAVPPPHKEQFQRIMLQDCYGK
jgi:hypothetical protein